jgi:hypothetical protein
MKASQAATMTAFSDASDGARGLAASTAGKADLAVAHARFRN